MIRTLDDLITLLGLPPRAWYQGGPFSPPDAWEVLDARAIIGGGNHNALAANFSHQALCYYGGNVQGTNKNTIILPIWAIISRAVSSVQMAYFDDSLGAPWNAAGILANGRFADRILALGPTGSGLGTGSADAAIVGLQDPAQWGFLVGTILVNTNVGTQIDLRGHWLGKVGGTTRAGLGFRNAVVNEPLAVLFFWMEADLRRITE